MAIRNGDGAPEDGTADPRASGRGQFAAGTPEDVAALYTWANLQGARYRDFSASRRRYREQIRNQAAHSPAELPDTAEEPLTNAAGEARENDAALEERRRGGPAIRWAASQRGWDSSSRSRGREQTLQRDRPDPAEASRKISSVHQGYAPSVPVEATAPEAARSRVAERASGPAQAARRREEPLARLNDDPLYRTSADANDEDSWEGLDPDPAEVEQTFANTLRGVEAELRRGSGPVRRWDQEPLEETPEFDGPAWLFAAPQPSVSPRLSVNPDPLPQPGGVPDTPAARSWSAMRDIVENEWTHPCETQATVAVGRRAPLLVLCSLAGGVGRTTLLATVGRALSASGERVVLGDAAPNSMLPFYFGGHELRPGEIRHFAPANDSGDGPISLVNYDLERTGSDAVEQRHLVAEIVRSGAECHRILLDLPMGSEWLLRRLATLQPTVLVPLLPDMNSVVSLEAVERYFDRFADEDGNPVLPFYLLSQFDSTLKLHRDLRDLLRDRLGERLLSFTVRRSPAVSEALAEGMTVTDYAPESPVARDFFDVAVWLRTMSPPVTRELRAAARSGRG